MSIVLETKSLIIRPFDESDAAAASQNSLRPSMADEMSDMILPDENAALRWIKWVNGKANIDQPWQVLAIALKENNQCIGIVGVIPQPKIQGEVEILFGISDEYQNRGYATEASRALIGWFFSVKSDSYLCAAIKTRNLPSQKVIDKLGFSYIEDRAIMYDGDLTMFKYYQLRQGN